MFHCSLIQIADCIAQNKCVEFDEVRNHFDQLTQIDTLRFQSLVA